MHERLFYSPAGLLTLRTEDEKLTAILFGDRRTGLPEDDPLLDQVEAELREYFAGSRKKFALPVHVMGTDFQKKVWAALGEIPYGETTTYGEIAERIGRPGACRAVGAANHANPVPIVIPCHRVIGAGGRLTGYAGGLAVKSYLLELEKRNK